MDSFDPVTQQGLGITNLFWLELGISAVLLAIVVVWGDLGETIRLIHRP